MIEFRYCPSCGALLTGKDLGLDGFHPWCETCDNLYIQPCPTELLAAIVNRKGEVLLTADGQQALPRFSVRYGEWLEDAFAQGCARLSLSPPLFCEYLSSFWDEASEVLLIGMKTLCPSEEAPAGHVWLSGNADCNLSEMDQSFLSLL